MANWEKFDEKFNSEELKKNVVEIERNNGSESGNYEKVPYGEYEVAVTKMEMKESKNGSPMVAIWFKVLTGECENRLLFCNQVITESFMIHKTNKLLRQFDTGDTVVFESYKQYAELIAKVFEHIQMQGLEYALDYGKTQKGFDTFDIMEVYTTEVAD